MAKKVLAVSVAALEVAELVVVVVVRVDLRVGEYGLMALATVVAKSAIAKPIAVCHSTLLMRTATGCKTQIQTASRLSGNLRTVSLLLTLVVRN